MFNQLTFKTMKKTFLTLLFAGVMTGQRIFPVGNTIC